MPAYKDMEHVNRLAVVAFRLFGSFAIDGGKDSRRQFAADASGEEILSESAAICRLLLPSGRFRWDW